MKINKNSWHYKFQRGMLDFSFWYNVGNMNTLCTYFWATVLSPVAVLFTLCVLAAFTGFALSLLICPWALWVMVYLGFDMFSKDASGYISYIAGFGFFGTFIYIVFTGIATISAIKAVITKAHDKSETVSILAEYVAAKKRGICPIINYVEDGKLARTMEGLRILGRE